MLNSGLQSEASRCSSVELIWVPPASEPVWVCVGRPEEGGDVFHGAERSTSFSPSLKRVWRSCWAPTPAVLDNNCCCSITAPLWSRCGRRVDFHNSSECSEIFPSVSNFFQILQKLLIKCAAGWRSQQLSVRVNYGATLRIDERKQGSSVRVIYGAQLLRVPGFISCTLKNYVQRERICAGPEQ